MGRVWEGVWKGFGRGLGEVWKDFERSGRYLGHFWDSLGCLLVLGCILFVFVACDCFWLSFSCFLSFNTARGERSERAKRASEALWCYRWLSLAYPCFRWRALALSCFLLLRFSACYLAFSFEWYPGTPSLTLPSVPGCSLPSYGFSCFTLCQRFLKKIALPVPC